VLGPREQMRVHPQRDVRRRVPELPRDKDDVRARPARSACSRACGGGRACARSAAGGNIEWREVKSLLDAVGATTEEQNGKLRVILGGETEVLEPPRGKDIDAQMIVDLRRMFTRAGATNGDGRN
jgi:hypothetical protein